MLKYAKVINEEIKEVSIGTGTNSAYYQSIGMTEMEVELGYDEKWYLQGYAPTKPLDELKEEKRVEINKARDEAEQGGFEYMGKVFDSDEISCLRMSCAAQAMALMPVSEPEQTITWTCQDNSTIDLTAAELLGLVAALAQWSNTCHEKATALKAQIDAATTNAEVEAVKWDCHIISIIPVREES